MNNIPTTHIAAKMIVTNMALIGTVGTIRMAYETPDTADVTAAACLACMFLAAFAATLSAAVSLGWHTVRVKRFARYDQAMRDLHPMTPSKCEYNITTDPNNVYEQYTNPAAGRHARQDTPS